MKRKIYALLLCCLVTGFVNGQTVFEKHYGDAYPVKDFGSCVQQTFDDGYIIAGYKKITPHWYGLIIKTDANGDTVWTKSFDGIHTIILLSVQQTTDSGYIFTGYINKNGIPYAYLVRTNPYGDTLWTKAYLNNTLPCIGVSVQQTSDGGFVMVGSRQGVGNNNDVYLVRTDGTGDTLWTKTFGGPNSDLGNSIQQTSDGGFIIAGDTGDATGITNVYLLKTDSNGTLTWSKTFGGANNDNEHFVQQTSDGGYIITGFTQPTPHNDVYLIRTDGNGDTLWTKTISDGSNDVRGMCARQLPDQGFIVAGWTANTANGAHDVYVLRTNSTGDMICTTKFGGDYLDEGTFISPTADGGFVIVGTTQSFTTYQDEEVYLIKIDSVCGSIGTGIIDESPETKYSVYPNPVHTQLSIYLGAAVEVTIRVYDLEGMIVELPITFRNSRAQLNTAGLPHGFYTLQITNNKTGESEVRKFVKEE